MASTGASSWRVNHSHPRHHKAKPTSKAQAEDTTTTSTAQSLKSNPGSHRSVQPSQSGRPELVNKSHKDQVASKTHLSPSRGTTQAMGPAGRKHHPFQAQMQGPILKRSETWHSWTELTVRVANLPSNITTWELWRTFEREGPIVFIEIFENRQGNREGTAKIRFSPAPYREFWTKEYVVVKRIEVEGAVKVRVELEPQKRTFKIQSPVRKEVFYPETMHMYPSMVSFGVMHDHFTMMNMYSAQALPPAVSQPISLPETSFKLDLLRGRIVIYFQVKLTDSGAAVTSAAIEETRSGQLDRINKYMFTIPLVQLDKIYKIELGGDQWSLIISLASPPAFFRSRSDLKASHSTKSLVWSEFDTWFRQTDIVYDPRQLETAEVALRKKFAVIDIGRWTTYRLDFDRSINESGVYETIQNALQDFNIEVIHLERFETIMGPSAAKMEAIWSLIDPLGSDEIGAKTSLFHSIAIADMVLPFEVRYQLEVCISHGIINEHNITSEFVNALADLARKDSTKLTHILEYAAEQERHIFDPMSILGDKEATAYSPRSKIPDYCAYSRKATITPTTIYYSSPAVETTNRVIRKYNQLYGDRFLRVQFTDEKSEGAINSCADRARNDEIYTRVWRTLRNGIRLGDRHYHFLAFGNSQFRQNGAYFFCPTDDLNCDSIRGWMGDFADIKVVAKYAARLGQCFSTTRAIHRSRPHVIRIEDVERNGYCFTDGVGKISEIFASMIATELNLPPSNPVPSTFQFRLGGCKGVLAKWPDVKGLDVHIRKSQSKFKAQYNGLEVIRCSQYSPATLNRQTIQILSSLGVNDEVFNRMLSEQLSNYQAAMTDKHKALDLLNRYIDDNQMTTVIGSMVLDGFMETQEPFLMSLLHLWRAWSIKLLKEKARIIVENGAFLLGVTDEAATLRGHKNVSRGFGQLPNVNQLPQIFVQIPDKNKKGAYVVIEGLCLVGRNPSLHPGDIRVVQAVNSPALYHLKDVVVFSQLGDRDVPSMCSGGDLDGDDFFVIWDKDLIPMEWNPEPMDYNSPKPTELNRPVHIQDVMKFFVRYMKNDTLGSIAHAHLAQSDFLDRSVKDSRCLELAELHSKAVDYIKTGEPAELPKHLRPRKWPHFMEKRHKPREQIYHSEKILGQLYDRVESVNFIPQYTQPFDRRIRDARIPPEGVLEAARQLKAKYDIAMRRIMAQQEIATEFEIWSTFSLSKPRVGTDYKMQEELANIAGALKDRFRRVCIEAAGGKDPEHLEPFVTAMYQVTSEEMETALTECRTTKLVGGITVPIRKMEPKYMPLISFPWLFYEVLCRIASGTEQREDVENIGLSVVLTRNRPEKLRKVTLEDGSDFDAGMQTEQGIILLGEEFDLERLPEHHNLLAQLGTHSRNAVVRDNEHQNENGILDAAFPPEAELLAIVPEPLNRPPLVQTNAVAKTVLHKKIEFIQEPILTTKEQEGRLEEVDVEQVVTNEVVDFPPERLMKLADGHHSDHPTLKEVAAGLDEDVPLEKLLKLSDKEDADDGEIETEEIMAIVNEEDSLLTKLSKLTETAEKGDKEVEVTEIASNAMEASPLERLASLMDS